jgi:hypothetical protein
MNDVVGLIIRFTIPIFVLSYGYRIVGTWTWGETWNIDGLTSLIEAVLLTSETGGTADVVDLD